MFQNNIRDKNYLFILHFKYIYLKKILSYKVRHPPTVLLV